MKIECFLYFYFIRMYICSDNIPVCLQSKKKNPSHIILTSLLPQREMTDQMTMSNVRVKNSHRSDSASVFPLVFLSTFTLYTIVEKFKTVYVFLWLLAWCGQEIIRIKGQFLHYSLKQSSSLSSKFRILAGFIYSLL